MLTREQGLWMSVCIHQIHVSSGKQALEVLQSFFGLSYASVKSDWSSITWDGDVDDKMTELGLLEETGRGESYVHTNSFSNNTCGNWCIPKTHVFVLYTCTAGARCADNFDWDATLTGVFVSCCSTVTTVSTTLWGVSTCSSSDLETSEVSVCWDFARGILTRGPYGPRAHGTPHFFWNHWCIVHFEDFRYILICCGHKDSPCSWVSVGAHSADVVCVLE